MDSLLASPVTLALLAANVIASIYALSNRDFFEQNVFWIGPIRKEKDWYRFLTSAFLHVNTTHLLLNMLTLYFFGPTLEAILGTGGFILVYFGALLAGNTWEYVDNIDKPDYRAVGASGAVSGIILSFCVFQPFALLGIMFIIPMWAIVFGVLYIGISFALSRRENTMIAHGAHLGGALAGVGLTLLLRPDALGRLIAEVSAKFS